MVAAVKLKCRGKAMSDQAYQGMESEDRVSLPASKVENLV